MRAWMLARLHYSILKQVFTQHLHQNGEEVIQDRNRAIGNCSRSSSE